MSKKLFILFTVALMITAYWALDLQQYLEFSAIKQNLSALDEYVLNNRWLALLLFFLIYVLVTGLSLPGAVLMTLLAGHLFGFWWGLVTVSFASSIGATLAFLFSRYILSSWVEHRFTKILGAINSGVDRDGKLYLFSLRLVPLFPFVGINLVSGLTRMKVWDFYWVSQIGMLAGTAVYVNAGVQLSQLDSPSGIFSRDILFACVLLAAFPFVAKFVSNNFVRYKKLKRFEKPKKFDANLIVIGAGSAGLVSAYIAAALKSRVVLIEENKMGGDCLNTGCVPSKAFIAAAKKAYDFKSAEKIGFENIHFDVNFKSIMASVHQAIKNIEPHDSIERYQSLGVECVQGRAKILSPYSVEVMTSDSDLGKEERQIITCKKIIVATGARPFVPPISGLNEMPFYTSDTIWQLEELPKHLLVMGAGPIGCELAQAFSLLGCPVTLVDRNDRVLSKEDQDVSEFVGNKFRNQGIKLLLNAELESLGGSSVDSNYQANIKTPEGEQVFSFSHLLIARGRKPNTENLGLNSLGVRLRDDGTIETDEYLESAVPGIYAAGDVTGPFQLTHAASHQSWYAAVNGLFSPFKKFRVDYRVMPRCTFVSPEVASVGLTENQAKNLGIKYELSKYSIEDLDRAITENNAEGFVKVLTRPGKDKILGVSIVAHNAGEMLAEFVIAMKHNIGLNKILATTHAYPTMAEANKFAAGAWKRNNAPQGILKFLERFHRWRRSTR